MTCEGNLPTTQLPSFITNDRTGTSRPLKTQASLSIPLPIPRLIQYEVNPKQLRMSIQSVNKEKIGLNGKAGKELYKEIVKEKKRKFENIRCCTGEQQPQETSS